MRAVALVLALLVPASAAGQDWPTPAPEDVSTIDGIMKAYYEVVSGPAGSPRNWDRDKSLHIPQALVVITGTQGDSLVVRPVTIAEWHQQSGDVQQNGFFEYEIARQVRQHGSTVHVWSTYEWRPAPDAPVGGRGVNSIEMVWDGSRYWITSWSFDGRGTPVPQEYLPQHVPGRPTGH